MRNTLTILILILSSSCYAQENTILLQSGKQTQLIFLSDIKSYKVSEPELLIVSYEENVLHIILSPSMVPFTEGNISIATNDSCYYAFDLKLGDATTFNYLFRPEDALFNLSTSTVENKIEEPKSTPIINQKAVEKETNIPIKYSTSFEKIFSKKGYIYSYNAVKFKNIYLALKGVYTQGNKLFFRIEVNNSSNVDYIVDYITFYTATKKTSRRATIEKDQKFPISESTKLTRITSNKTLEIIYEFDLFTIAAKKVFYIDLTEGNGDRTLSLPISSEVIINSQKI